MKLSGKDCATKNFYQVVLMSFKKMRMSRQMMTKLIFVAPLITNHDAGGVLSQKDLSVAQADKETVLAAEYADEFSLERMVHYMNSCKEEDQFFVAFTVCIVHANIFECQQYCSVCLIGVEYSCIIQPSSKLYFKFV
jgi:hypothetical protein